MNNTALIHYLRQCITDERWHNMQQKLAARTTHITCVLEQVSQPQNLSAIARTMECTGIQEIHAIHTKTYYTPMESIAMGSTQWLILHQYSNTRDCFATLKQLGYRIVATSPAAAHTATPFTIPLHNKMAFVFGTELTGLSQEALSNADDFITIPMFGFTQSFNVSVSAALVLYSVMQRLRESSIAWQLTPDQKETVLLHWLRNTISGSAALEKRFVTQEKQK